MKKIIESLKIMKIWRNGGVMASKENEAALAASKMAKLSCWPAISWKKSALKYRKKMAKLIMKSFEAQKWRSANVSMKINGSENNENNHQWRERKRKMKVAVKIMAKRNGENNGHGGSA
jgi:hypothetical protein